MFAYAVNMTYTLSTEKKLTYLLTYLGENMGGTPYGAPHGVGYGVPLFHTKKHIRI